MEGFSKDFRIESLDRLGRMPYHTAENLPVGRRMADLRSGYAVIGDGP